MRVMRWIALAVLLPMSCLGQGPATTTVSDTVYAANGQPASGSVLVSWGAFTTASGVAVPAGSTSAAIGTNGVVTLALVPNAGSTPMGSYYTAVFHLSDGTVSREYWVVPVQTGSTPVTLGVIRNSVLPATVAMQTVSKQYVDTAIQRAVSAIPGASSTGIYVEKAGDTMTGPLVLPGDPTSALQAADKNYVDGNVAALTAGLAQKVSLVPAGGQVISQPAGTELGVNDLNGDLYAGQYLSGAGNNGIQNALSQSQCATGCTVRVDSNYGGVDSPSVSGLAARDAVVDARGGATVTTSLNPVPLYQVVSAGQIFQESETRTAAQFLTQEPGAVGLGSAGLIVKMSALAGGSNQFPESIEAPPYFKSTYGTLTTIGNYWTQGQHVQNSTEVNCYAVGDCLAGGQFIRSSGGYRDSADEGTHPFDLLVSEDTVVFTGTCASGCTTGATSVVVSATTGAATQGDGRFLIDKAAGKVITAGSIVSGGRTFLGTVTFTGTSFPVSVFLETAAAAVSQAKVLAPGTVTLPIQTTGLPSGFAGSTAALPAGSGIACVADSEVNSGVLPNFEMAPYQTVDGTHIQLTLNKVHGANATIAVGGLCGYGLEQTVDTTAGIRQVFPVVGSTSATGLYYADGRTTVVGQMGTTSSYINLSLSVASIARNNGTVTVTTAGNLPADVNGLTLTVAGVADSSYNGQFAVTTTGANTLTYAQSGTNSTSTGGTVSLLTGGYVLYPMAEILSVMNPATKSVDGTLTLAPNTVAWASGDAVEVPHFYEIDVSADTEFVQQYQPRPSQYTSAGKSFQGTAGPGLRGWQVQNLVPSTTYIGGGGMSPVPDAAYEALGVWNRDLEVTAGTSAVVQVHCNLHGCNRWNSGYQLFALDSATGFDSLTYQPQASTAIWSLGPSVYSFSPTGFSAGTINVGTLNATTITGGVSGGSITSGTIAAARLPVFGPSGTSHAVGAVPDPGATAGSTRFLREDGTWSVPAGGSSGGAAGGDLSGSYPNPTVSAVHATSGTLDGVAIGGTNPGNATVKALTAGGSAAATNGSVNIYDSAGAVHTTFGPNYINANGSVFTFTASQTQFNGIASYYNTLTGAPSASGLTVQSDPYGNVLSDYINLQGYNGSAWENVVRVGNVSSGHATLSLQGSGGSTVVGGTMQVNSGVLGPASAPSGACTITGAWVFSQDGHATFCNGTSWVTKI